MEVVLSGHDFRLDIWDTAGQERFQSLGAAFYRGADCCVLVYDININKSFDKINNWHNEFLHQLTENKATEWCASRGNIPYIETSAKEGYNVDEAFLRVAKISLDNERVQDM
ncbi:unnamed protein product [Lupinus luteus]|uniref:Uncharacterized protein n=1 Tax=Lupinus luteus TaxID=3873 RepID=A0AAV1WB81_LUPLU